MCSKLAPRGQAGIGLHSDVDSNARHTAEYIAEMARDLAIIAKHYRFMQLADLLELAKREADSQLPSSAL